MLSQTAEYALRAMVALATRSRDALTAQEIAVDSHVPLDYLSKVLSLLSRAGLVRAQRGRGGGFQPARPAAELTVLEVVSAVDPLRRIKSCPLGLEAHGENLCPLHRKLDDAVRSVEEAFAATTIESLVGGAVCEGACHAKAV
ncbi:MAG TPA: Rrf2 family transcriptional regulator [Bryobacteraceae bacterium]|nr:Rrf2 family transcriptional regulator [Bryobacteraceae bacterium]